MVLGIGCDIIRIDRMLRWITRENLLKRYFTSSEIKCLNINTSSVKHRSIEKLSGIFASKEAYKKAVGSFGIGGINLKDIVVETMSNGAPRLKLERSAAKALSKCSAQYAHVSISHEKEYCVAMVVIGR